jgi:hypothetical protein
MSDTSGLLAALEANYGAATLWGWVKEWISLSEIWDDDERTPLADFLYERAGMENDDERESAA